MIFVLCFSLFQYFSKNSNRNNLFADNSNASSLSSGDVVDFSMLTYSALGDSITEGYYLGCEPYENSLPKVTYPDMVKEILGLSKIVNYGVGGTTISNVNNGMVNRYKNITLASDIISIQGGINDARMSDLGHIDSFDESTFIGAYNSLIKGLKEIYSDCFIFLMSMPKTYNSTVLDVYVSGNEFGYNYLDYNNAIYEIAEKWELPLLDLYLLDGFVEDTEKYDGCHPSQTYVNTILSPAIAQFIKDNYNK